MTVKGTVTAWVWTNPHSFLKFDAKDDKGNVVHWLGEWNAPSTLVNFGITAKSFKAGRGSYGDDEGHGEERRAHRACARKSCFRMVKSSAWVNER